RLCVGGENFLPPTDKSASVAEMGGGSVAGMGGGSVAGTGGGSVAEMGAGWVARGWGHLRLSSHSLARVHQRECRHGPADRPVGSSARHTPAPGGGGCRRSARGRP